MQTAYLLFFDKSDVWHSRFSPKNFKHVSLLIGENDEWVRVNPGDDQIFVEKILIRKLESKFGFIDHLSHAVKVSLTEPPHKKQWFIKLSAVCNECVRWVSGIECGWTFHPGHLYRNVLKYSGKRNYKVLGVWKKSTLLPHVKTTEKFVRVM